MEYQRGKLKEGVKQAIKQTRPRPIWITLLYLVLSVVGGTLIRQLLNSLNWSGSIASYFIHLTLQGVEADVAMEYILRTILYDGAGMVVAIFAGSLLITVLTYLWRSLMAVGYAGYCLAMVRGQRPGAATLFQAFPRVGGVLLTRILVWVFTFLWNLLFTAGFVVVVIVALALSPASSFLAGLLIVAGVAAFAVAMIWLSLRYCLTDYALLDGESGLGAIRASKELMRGNYRRLFVLRLSFIGWYLVMIAVALVGLVVAAVLLVGVAGAGQIAAGNAAGAVIALGVFWVVMALVFVVEYIILLWLAPYLTGCEARFYDFLKGRPLEQEPWGGWDSATYSGSGQGPEGWGRPQQPPQEPEQPRDGGEQGGEDPKDPPPSGPSYPKY